MNTQADNKAPDPISDWLKRSAAYKKWRYLNYGQQDDFKSLWDIDRVGENGTETLLIDWNGFPAEHQIFPRIVEFLTPLDWALAVAYHRVEKDPLALNLPVVVIVDRCSHRYPGSFAVEMRRALTDALGHALVFSALGDDSEDALAFVKLLQNGSVSSTRTPRLGQLRALRQAWIGYTVQSRDHHDINNLLGPLALPCKSASEKPAPDEEPDRLLEQALLKTATWMDLVEYEGGVGDDGWALCSHLTALATDKEPIAAVLIDDQAHPWTAFLRSAFAGGNVHIHAISKPHEVLGGLDGLTTNPPFSRRLLQDCGKGAPDQILFLDLRFFPRGGADERAFFAKLCEHILTFSLERKWQDDPHFGDAPLSARDQDLLSSDDWNPATPLEGLENSKFPFLQGAKRILECPEISWETLAKGRLYDHLLTLFPRFLAQILFTTPIVLFSSTGRRDLTEHFKAYGNIITAFEKPRLPVRHDHVARSFRMALDQAARLLDARRRLRRSVKESEKPQGDGPAENKHYHVELFIDEFFPHKEEPRNVWVGGFYAIFAGDDVSEAQAKAAEFDDELVRKGFSYFTRGPYGPQLPVGAAVKDKKQAATNELKQTLRGEHKPLMQGLVRIKCDARKVAAAPESSGDDAYRRALGVLVKCFLHEAMVHYFGDSLGRNVSVSIFAGTRVRVAEAGDTDTTEHVRQAAYRWGFTLTDNEDGGMRLESLARSTLAPIIADLREFRGDRWPIQRAVAVRMIYDFDKRKNGPSFAREGMLVCRKCRTTCPVKISKAMGNAPIPIENKDWVQVAAIRTDTHGKAYALLTPHDHKKQERHQTLSGKPFVFFHSDNWGGFPLVKGADLLVTMFWDSYNGFSIGNVYELIEPTGRPSRGIAWDTIAFCPNCHQTDSLRPDYPGGLYIADEVVSEDFDRGSYGPIVGKGPLDFDDVLDDGLRCLIEAGRLADAGDRVNAALKVAAAYVAGLGAYGGSMRHKILGRLAPTLGAMTGGEFHRYALALGVPIDSPDAGALVRVVLSGFDKSWNETQVERTVRAYLESNQQEEAYLTNVTASKSRYSGTITCKTFCSEQLARWFVNSQKNAQKLNLPWANAQIQ